MFYDRQISDQRSVWEAHNPMPTISELMSPSVHGSQVYPQYSSDNRQMQQYRQGWIPEGYQSIDNRNMKR